MVTILKILGVCVVAVIITLSLGAGCTGNTTPAEQGKLGSTAPSEQGKSGSSPDTSTYQSQGPWTGTWQSEQWGTMELVQDGSKVTGTYTWDEGKIEGMANGNMLTGTWSESPGYQPPDDAGDFKFALSDDGNSFTGEWRYGSTGDWQGSWNGKRLEQDSRALIGK